MPRRKYEPTHRAVERTSVHCAPGCAVAVEHGHCIVPVSYGERVAVVRRTFGPRARRGVAFR